MRLSILSALTALFVFGCGKSNPGPDGKGSNPPGPTGGTPDGGVDLASAKPDHTATADEWHAEFKKDKEAARKKYAGKVIELTGTVRHFAEEDNEPLIYVHLKVDDQGSLGVRCLTKDTTVWETVAGGTQVVIRGKLPEAGVYLPSDLLPVVVEKADKNPALTATAADLCKQFKSDVEKFREKYDGKWVYVEGEVVSTGKSSHGRPQFTLKGDGGINVVCTAAIFGSRKVGALKRGQKVKAVGEMKSPSPGDKELNLNDVLFKKL